MAGLDLKAVYDSFRQGQAEARQNRLADLDELGRNLQGQVLAGDKSKLNDLMQVDAQRGMQTKRYMTEQQKAETAEFLQAAYSATTPEAWRSVVDRFRARGHQFDLGEDDFANRENLLREGMSIADQEGIKWRQAEADRAQANADRAYGLQLRGFEADERNRAAQLALEKAKLGAAGPDLVELFDEQSGQPYKARYNPQTGGFDRVGGVKAPNGTHLEVGPDGTISFTQGMGKITEGQGKDISYLNRMLTAGPILDKNDEALTSFGENVAGNAPLVGNYMKSSQFQQAEQAGRNFLTALLRKESGAQIPPSEERSYGDIFLPRPGDKKEVIAQKREARRQAAIGIRMGLPAPIIKGMVQQGVDFTTLDPAARAAGGAKGNMQPQSGKTRRGITFEVGQ